MDHKQDSPSPLEDTKAGGPQTPEGKAKSSQNAIKHGILAVYATSFDPLDIAEVYNEFAKEFGDNTPSRQYLMQQLALTVVRLARCGRAESELIQEAMDPPIVRVDPCLPDLYTTVVVSKGQPATISFEYMQRLALIYERYEPKLVARLLRLIAALKEAP